jgi:hypothetical protein
MRSKPSKIKGFRLLDESAQKAIDDPAYRRDLVANPRAELPPELQVDGGVTITVHVNTAQEIHLVVPTSLEDKDKLNVNETDVQTLSTAMHF